MNFFLGEGGRCSLQRLHLLGSPGGVGDGVEEDGGPRSAEGVLEVDHLSGLGGSGELGRLPTCGAGFDVRVCGTAGNKEEKQGAESEKNLHDRAGRMLAERGVINEEYSKMAELYLIVMGREQGMVLR